MKRRPRVVTILALVVLAALVVIFRRPLVAWFTGDDVASPSAHSTKTTARAGPFALSLTLEPDPPRQEKNTLVVDVADDGGKPVADAEVAVDYLMPAMGAMPEMKGSATVKPRGDGRFAAAFDLPMAGSWTLTTRVRSGAERGEATLSITVGQKGLAVAGADAHAPTAFAVKPLALPDETLGAVQEAMSALDRARAALASDTIDGVPEAGTRVATFMRDSAASVAPADAKQCLADGARAADSLAASRDIEAARRHFAEVTASLTALASADPRLQEGWRIFECPMVQEENRWLQRGDTLENPYMGKKMLACGTSSTFAPRASETTPSLGAAPDDNEVEYYTCAMHPSVKQEQPGNCPICAMALTPVTKGELRSGVVLVDDIRRQKIGVKTAPVEKRSLDETITTVGRVVYDEEKLHDVTLRIGGFVEELFVDETGQKVQKGQPLFLIYSPELYSAQIEHVQALKTQALPQGTAASTSLVTATARRLHLFGLDDKQIGKLTETGEAAERVPILSPASGYVVEKHIVKGTKIEEGATLYRIAGLDEIWIEADIYEADLPKIAVGQSAAVSLPYLPGKELTGKVTFIFPFLDKDARTGRVRIEMKNPGLALRPEMYANVTLTTHAAGDTLVVPDSAVIYAGPRRLVFVDLGEGRMKPIEVHVGRKAAGAFEVLDGLKEGDVVVTSGNFLIAAESRLKGATQYWAEGGHDDHR